MVSQVLSLSVCPETCSLVILNGDSVFMVSTSVATMSMWFHENIWGNHSPSILSNVASVMISYRLSVDDCNLLVAGFLIPQ